MDGTSFEIDLGVAGAAGAETAASSLDRLVASLAAAKTESEAAAAAVAAGETAYAQAESAADRAAKALERVTIAAQSQAGKVQAALEVGDLSGAERAQVKFNALIARQQELAIKSDAARAAVVAEAAALDKLKTAAGAAEQKEAALVKATDLAAKAATNQKKLTAELAGSGKVNEIAEAFGKLGGPLGSVGQKAFGAAEGLKKLVGSLGTTVGAVAGVTLVIVALVAGLAVAAGAVLKFALANADAARTSELLSAGIAKSVAGGAELDDAIGDLSKRVPQSRDELQKMAADLAKTGLKGRALTDALEAAAEKAAEAKFGPNWQKQLTSLDKLAQLFKGHVSDIFRINAEPLLDAFGKIVALFDTASPTGQAMKVVFQDLFQFLADSLAALAPKIIAAFIQFEIWVLKALIAIKPFGSTIVTVAKVVGVALLAVVGVVGVLVAAWIAVTAAVMGFAIGLGYVGVKIVGLVGDVLAFVGVLLTEPGRAFDMIKTKASEAFEWLASFDIAAIGAQLIQGLIDGIMGGGSSVLSAMTGVVGGAVDAAKKALGIASPSKVFAEIGMQTAAGMAVGVEGETSNVSSALETMVAPPDVTSSGGGSSGGGGSINLAGAQFTFNGVEGAEDAEGRFRDLLTKLLDGDLASLGAEAPA